MGWIYGNDMSILRKVFMEASQAVGITANYYEVNLDKSSENIYHDKTKTYKDPISVEIIFDDHPKINYLKNMGWYDEEDQFKPMLIYLPVIDPNGLTLNVMEDSIVELTINNIIKDYNKFIVTKKQLDSVFSNYWVCKCAPYRERIFTKSYTDDGFTFLSLNKEIKRVDSGEGIDTASMVVS